MTLTSTTCDWYVPQGGTFNVYETSNATALCYVNATQSGFSTDVDITGTLTVGSLTDHYTRAGGHALDELCTPGRTDFHRHRDRRHRGGSRCGRF